MVRFAEVDKRLRDAEVHLEEARRLVIAARDELNAQRKPRAPRQPKEPGNLQLLVDHFDQAYRARAAGQKPTWGPMQVSHLKRLLAAHGLDVCKERIDRLFRVPWLDCPDVKALVYHFDRLAPARRPGAGLSAEELLRGEPLSPEEE